MEVIQFQSIDNPVFLGQLERVSNISQKDKVELRQLVQGGILSLFFFAALGLGVSALLHRQLACLPYFFLMWSPLSLFFFLPKLAKLSIHLDEQTIAIVDWLTQRTREKAFGGLPLKRAEIVWLTQNGLYTYQKRLFPWRDFLCFSLEEGTLADGLKPIYRLKLRLKEASIVSRKRAYASFILLILPVLIGAISLFYFVPHYGIRDDVLALLFSTGASIQIFAYMAIRYIKDRNLDYQSFVIMINQRWVSAEDLLNLLNSKLPVNWKS